MFDVTVVGSANLDLVAQTERIPGPGETLLASNYAEHAGGKGLNQAVAARRAGATTAFIGAVGSDAAGHTLSAVLAAEGIDAAGVDSVEAPTGRALITVSADAENSIVVVPGANALVRPPTSLAACRVVATQLEIPTDAVRAALDMGRSTGATTVLNPAPAAHLDGQLLSLVDVLTPNEHELDLLGGVDALLAAGVAAVVVTLGAAGAEIHRSGQLTERVEPFPVEAVDTTGAGDAFNGALAACLAEAAPLTRAVQMGCAAGALAATVSGAVPSLPRREQIEALVG